jgi:hypothetical protein
MLSFYIQTFVALVEEVLIYLLKLFYRNIFNFPKNIFFQFFHSGVTVVNFGLQTTTEEKITRI